MNSATPVRARLPLPTQSQMKRLSPRCGDDQRRHISAPDRIAIELRQSAPVNSAEIRGASRRMSANFPTTRWNARAQRGTRPGWPDFQSVYRVLDRDEYRCETRWILSQKVGSFCYNSRQPAPIQPIDKRVISRVYGQRDGLSVVLQIS